MKPHSVSPRSLFPPAAPLRFIEPLEARIAPAVVVLNVDSLANDVDADGVADPGDRIHYTVTVQNTGPGDVTGLTFQEILNNPALTLVANSINVSPLAFNDSYTAVGNTTLRVGNPAATTGPATTNATHLLANDTEFLSDTLAANVTVSLTDTSNAHGTVTLVTSGPDKGSFSYISDAGYTGPASFTYTLRDDGIDNIAGNADDLTGTGTVAITVGSVVWYVDDSAAAGGTGRSNSPFNTLTPVNGAGGAGDADAANQTIYVFAGSYSTGIVLEGGQQIIGEGDALVVDGFTLVAAGTDPTIGGTTAVTLASGNTVRGVTLNATTTGISGNNVGVATIGNVVISGGQTGVLLGGSGTATFDSLTSITGTTSAAFNVNTSTASITYSGSISESAAGAGIDINAHTVGTIAFQTGTISSTGGGIGIEITNSAGTYNFSNAGIVLNTGAATAVLLASNTGATIAFTGGGLDIDTTSGIGFTSEFAANLTVSGANNTVTTGAGSTAGIRINDTGIPAAGVAFASLNATSPVNGILLTNATGAGSFTVTGGSIVGATTRGVDISGGTNSITYGGTITTAGTGRSVEVTGHTANTVTFSGNITDTGTGINVASNTGGTIAFSGASKSLSTGANTAVTLSSNTGATINFTGGGLAITTTGIGVGFSATGDGTVNVTTGANDNTISSATGTALNIANTTIGASGLTFRSIAANGAASGIILNTTGTAGGLSVTGTGTTVGSGGTIQNTTGVGISLTSTANVSLNGMTIANTGSHGVSGTGVTNVGNSGTTNNSFSFTNGLLDSPGDADNESVLFFDSLGATNITGRMTVSGTTMQNFEDAGVHVGNVSGALVIDVTSVIFNNNSDTNGEEGIDVDASGTANITLNVTGTPTGLPSSAGFSSTTRFIDLEGGAINAVSQGNGVLDLNLTSVHITTGTPGGPDNFPTPPALTFSAEGSASAFRFDIINSRIDDSSGDGIFIGHEGTIEGRITGNTITGIALGDGIRIDTDTTSNTTATILIQNNIITGVGDDGIQVLHRDGTKTLNLTINSNTITNTASEGIRYFADDDVAGGGPLNRLQITNNTFGNNGTLDASDSIVIISQDPGTDVNTEIIGNTSVEGITLQQSLSAVLSIEQASTAALGTANGGAVVTATGTITFNTAVSVPQPANPLMFEPGEENPVTLLVVEPPVIVDAPVVHEPVQPPVVDETLVVQPPMVVDDGLLSQAELDSLVGAAIARWAATGLSAAQVSLLQSVVFTVEDLPGWYLGSAGAGVVALDANAAGNQWFVDATPLDDSEFASGASGLAVGRVDALTTILHELGHQLGLDDTYASADSASLMYGWLTSGERRLPTAGQAADAEPGDHAPSGPDFLFGAMNIGTLPANKTLTIVYDATINNLTNGLAPVINSQVRILGNGGINVLSDDPAAGGAADPTVTPLDTLTLGGAIWNDLNKDGDLDAGEPGVNGVTLNLFGDTDGNGSFSGADALVATTTTAAGGAYSFANLLPGEYLVQVAQPNFNAGGALATLTLSSPNAPDPDNNTDNDDNGVLLGGQGAVSAAITLAYNTEPTAGPGNDTNNTLDFGFSAPIVDLQITKTDFVTSVVPGTQNLYTITVSNAGPDGANGATVADTFPAAFTGVTWTAGFAGGATGSASGAGNINQTVNLPAGATIVYTVLGTIDPAATGSLSNTATIAAPAGISDSNNGNNSATDSNTLTPQVDLTIAKTDDAAAKAAGAANTYTIVVSNTGPSNTTGATVTDTFPAIFTGATWTAILAGGATGTVSGSGNINQTVNLPTGSSITYTVNGTIDPAATGTLSNTATVTAPGTVTDTAPANNSATDTTQIGGFDLTLTKSDGIASTTPGSTLTYTLGFANNGSIAATGVVITEMLPLGTTFTAASNPGWERVDTTLTFAIGNLSGGASGSTTLVLKVDAIVPAGVANIDNTATISDDGTSSFADLNPANNTATDIDVLDANAAFTITKEDIGNNDNARLGDALTYRIVVTNTGNQGATGVRLTETLPAGTTFDGGGLGAATWADAGGGSLVFDVGTLEGDQSVTITFQVVVDSTVAAGLDAIFNTVTVADDGNNGAPPQTATDADTLAAAPDLVLTKDDGTTVATPGGTLIYTLNYSNAGTQGATGVTIVETLPLGTTFVAGDNPGWSQIGNTLNFAVGALAAGANGSTTLKLGVIASFAAGFDEIVNTAEISDDGANGADTTPADNTTTDTDTLTAAPDLVLTKTDGFTDTTAGATLTYTFTYQNNGTQGATGLKITDPLPTGTTFVAADNPGWTLVGGQPNFAIAGELAPGAGGNATLKLKVKGEIPLGLFAITNVATIGDDGDNGADLTPANNTATDINGLPPLQLSKDKKSALYLDVDGDLVTVKTTKGTFELTDFTRRAAGLGIIVERLLLAGDDGFKDTTLTWTAKPQPGNRGDGMVNVGAIDATGLNLKAVTIPGDLGQIDAGSGAAKPAALGALSVQSLGRFGLDTQNAGLTPSLTSTITGPLGKLTVKTDIDGAFINVVGANGTIGSVNVGRSLLGGAAGDSGSIQSAQNMGAVKVGGHLLGGGGSFSGAIHSLTTIKSVNVGGALLGGAGATSGSIFGQQGLGAVSVKSDLRGDAFSSGAIVTLGSIKSATVGGGLFGGATGSGSISAGVAIGNVTIAGNLEGGFGATGILAAATIGAVKIGGDVGFGLSASEAPLIVAGGVLDPDSAKAALAIKSVSIGGSVRGFNLLAGFDTNFTPINADASIGQVTVKGDWSSSNLLTAVEQGGDGMFGTDDDFVFNGGGNPDILASVASVRIGGVARGAAGGPLVFLAEKFGAFKSGTTAFPLTADFDDLIVGTNGIRMRELNAATAPDPVLNPTIPVSVLDFSDGNKTATFTDLDGDEVTIKTSKGDLSAAGVLDLLAGGAGGAQLRLINLAGLTDFDGANLTITAKRTDAGGNGFVDVGAIDATNINLGKVSIAGDLGQIDAGNADDTTPAIASLTVQSLGAAGLNTQGPGGSLQSETRGALGKLVVKSDIVFASVHVGGGQNGATNDGPLGKLGSVSIGRSLIGDQDDTGVISASGTMGKVTIGGDVRASVGDRSGSIRADGAMSDVTIGGSLLGGLGADSGSVAGKAGVGNVTVKQSLRGGGDDRAGSILALGGNLRGVKIGGHLVGGSDDFAGAILSVGGAIGNVSIAGSLLAFGDDRTGIFSDTTLGAVKIGGDMLGGNGFAAKISAEGFFAPASAAKAVVIKSLDIGGVARFVRVLAGFNIFGAPTNADAQIGSVKVKGDWIAGDIAAGVDSFSGFFGDGDDASISGGGDSKIVSRIGAIVIGGQAAGTVAGGDSFGFAAQQLGSVKVGKSAFKLGKKPTDPLDHISIGITLDLAAREVV